jgi:MoaA/NifB/PqqE/SkfB family radical SAM enzyme
MRVWEMSEIEINDPYLVQLNTTGKCPYNCKPCYMSRYRSLFLTIEDIMKLWENLKKYHCEVGISYEVILTGGDLFYHPHWRHVLRYLCEEKSVSAIEPLLNKFWTLEDAHFLFRFKDKISRVQLNLDAVSEQDIEVCREHDVVAVVKVALGKSPMKQSIDKALNLVDKYDDVVVGVDIIVDVERNAYELSLEEINREVERLRRIFGKKFVSTDPLVDQDSICMIPFAGLTVYPDRNIRLCAHFPNIATTFTIDNFDLIEYVKRYYDLTIKARRIRGCPLIGMKAGVI